MPDPLQTRTDFGLFDPPPTFRDPNARNTDPKTSHLAARDAKFNAGKGRFLALASLATEGPGTDYDLAARTGWQQNSIGKRRGECVAAGFARATTERRRTPSGSLAIVWEITDAGRDFLLAANATK